MSTQPGSAYFLDDRREKNETHTLSVVVDNEPGVLARVIGLFSGRGYNIESLTVAETDRRAHTSRVTIVTRGTPHVLGQIEAQLEKMVSTRHVQDVTRDPNGLERELALIKVKGTGADRVEALQGEPLSGRRHHLDGIRERIAVSIRERGAALR
jgi:acetolactate synthase-1/3 small subunit